MHWNSAAAMAAGALLAAVSATPAAALTGVTSVAALGATDSIDWGQLGSSFTVVGSPTSVVSGGGLTATVTSAGGIFERRDQGNGWGGNFANGEHLLWDQGAGPDITITFANPVEGLGAQIQSDFFGAFTAHVIGSNGAVLGSFSEDGYSDGNGDNSAIFIGLTGGGIKSIEFDLTAAPYGSTNDFAIGTLYIATSAVPEPAAWAVMLVGLGGLGVALRSRRKAALA